MSTGLLFAPKLRYLAPSLLGWNSYLSASEAFTKFQENIINEHKATYVEGHHRCKLEVKLVLILFIPSSHLALVFLFPGISSIHIFLK